MSKIVLRISQNSPIQEKRTDVIVRRDRGVIISDPAKFLSENMDCVLIKTNSPKEEPLLLGVQILEITVGLNGKSPECWAHRWLYKRTKKPAKLFPIVWTDAIRKEKASSAEDCYKTFIASTKRPPRKKAGRVKKGWQWGQAV